MSWAELRHELTRQISERSELRVRLAVTGMDLSSVRAAGLELILEWEIELYPRYEGSESVFIRTDTSLGRRVPENVHRYHKLPELLSKLGSFARGLRGGDGNVVD